MTFKPKVVLASFPRSGNTYLRNIMLDVYSVFSWNNIGKYQQAYERLESLENLGRDGSLPVKQRERLDALRVQVASPVVKTHELPGNILPFCESDTKCVYLVRDGRDALVSMAHHRKDIIEPGTDFLSNLKEAILAKEGSYFGGWSENVRQWRERADVVIYFEELIIDPIRVMKPVEELLGLSGPDISKLPTFESQREGSSHYGGQSRKNMSEEEKRAFNEKFFRKGEPGAWKTEMPSRLARLFWKYHGEVSLEMGYRPDGSFRPERKP